MMDNRSWPGRLLNRKSEQNVPSKQAYFSRNTPYADGVEAAVPAIWRKGDVILDQYEVIGTLGEGGMGTVYKVHHRGWNTDLAVKSPKPEIFAKADGKENFIREAETWINLGLHPHIVSCYYVRTLGSIPRIFAEYLAGGSLANWIGKRKLYEGGSKQALERILDVAIQFAWGLHYAHEQGLVHQDVKPANVMMASDGTVKVTDFGLAKARAMAGEVGIQTASGAKSVLVSSRGMTPAYCSPEQAIGQALSRRTDIWSWGVSILEMFVGSVTWMVGVVAREVLACHEAQDPALPAMPAAVVKLLARCFQPCPQDRPATMLEVATVLQEIYERELEHPYPRQTPKAADALADSLNNRALSLYDLGKIEEAKQVWQQALQVDPHHVEATYNQGPVLWRQGMLTDDVLVRQLEEVRATQSEGWQPNYLLALVQIERGDGDTALSLLRETAQRTPEQKEVRILLERVQSGAHPLVRRLRTFSGHTGSVTSVCLSADGRFALSGSDDQSVRLWEVASGQCLRTFSGHTDWVASVSLNADGRFALSGSLDNTLRLWEVASGGCLRIFGRTGLVTSVCLSADARLALSTSKDQTMRLWEVASGQCLRTSSGGMTSVYLSADGRFALSGCRDNTLRLWEVASGQCLHTFSGHTDWVTSVCLSVGGRWALSGSHDKTMRLWEVTSGQCLRTFSGHTGSITSVSLSADGRFALSGSSDKTMRLWEVASGQCLRTFSGHTDLVTSVCLSADARLALSGSLDKTMRLWELPQERFVCPVRLSQVWSHTDVLYIEAKVVGLLQQAEQSHVAKALGLLSQVRALPGWERAPKSLEAWARLLPHCSKASLSAGWLARTFIGHTEEVISVCLSADARLALSGSLDKTVRLWEVASGQCLGTFTGHTYSVTSVCLGANDRWALSGSYDKTMRLWEVATGQCLRTFIGHTDCVKSVNLSADSRWALSGSWDTTMRLWEVASGECLRTFTEHTERVSSVSLSANGRWALSGSHDKTVQLWELDWELEARELTDWDEGARSYLEIFLTQHTPYASMLPQDRKPSIQEVQQALTRRGRPSWNEDDFQKLIQQLQYAGYGWLRPEGVRKQLEHMARTWQGPSPLLDA
jgi:WD40 repeat protein/serine/threonine protein kinase